jgi:hypothetical protein
MTTTAVATVEQGNFGDQIQTESFALSAPVGGEVDVQIATAKRYPRSIQKFKEQALEMATFDEATAAGCFYSLPRGGKPIEGPSARLAEIVLSAWGNVRADARVVAIEDKEIVAEAMTWDLEKNVAIRVQVRRRIVSANGKRYNDDMITMTGNAACAIALRNSVFKVIPNVFTNAIYHAARQTAIGDIKTIASKRDEMVSYFGKMGVTADRVFAAIGKGGIEEIGINELATLKGVATALKDGEYSIDDAFPPVVDRSGLAGVAAMKKRIQGEEPVAEAAAEPVPFDTTAAVPVADEPAAETPAVEEPATATVTDDAELRLFELRKIAVETFRSLEREDRERYAKAQKWLGTKSLTELDEKKLNEFLKEFG